MTPSSQTPQASSGQNQAYEGTLSAPPPLAHPERRRAKRVPTDQLIYMELGDGNGGILLNVSEEGCGFLAIGPIWEKTPQFAFAIGGGRRIQGGAGVAWVDQTKKLGGLRFLNPSPAFRAQMGAWLAEPKSAPLSDPKQEVKTDILGFVVSRYDSPAKQRRAQLRAEARAEWEAAELAKVRRERAGAERKQQFEPDRNRTGTEIETRAPFSVHANVHDQTVSVAR